MAADKTPRRLGRGLDALLGAAPRDEKSAAALQQIPVDLIAANPFQPRREFPPAELEELKESLDASGLLQPITVRRSAAGRGYQLIAGERRWRAAQSLGWKEIAAIVKEADDQTMLALALVENLQRADLNPLDEAQGYRHLTEFGLTQENVAKLVGKSRSTVANFLRLLDLPSPVQTMLRSGELTAGQVRPLLTVGDAKQVIALASEIRDRRLPARVVEERAAKRSAKKGRGRTPSTRRDSGVAAMEDALRKRLQTDVKIASRRGGGGEIHVRFYSPDDLERVAEQMGVKSADA